jgi:hypothetical protein
LGNKNPKIQEEPQGEFRTLNPKPYQVKLMVLENSLYAHH